MLIRPYRATDRDAVVRVFRATVLAGRPAPFSLGPYRAFCLDWFLEHEPEEAAVAVEDGEVFGYRCASVRLDAYAAWQRRNVGGVTAWLVWHAASGFAAPRGRFGALRLVDGATTWRAGPASSMPATVHVNALSRRGTGHAGYHLWRQWHANAAMLRLPGYFAEVNALPGRRDERVWRRTGAEVVARVPNRTFSALLGVPVERLTVEWRLAQPANDFPANSAPPRCARPAGRRGGTRPPDEPV